MFRAIAKIVQAVIHTTVTYLTGGCAGSTDNHSSHKTTWTANIFDVSLEYHVISKHRSHARCICVMPVTLKFSDNCSPDIHGTTGVFCSTNIRLFISHNFKIAD